MGLVCNKLSFHRRKPIRLPFWLGLLAGFCGDLLSFVTGKNFVISSVRVKKFCSFTQFSSSNLEAENFSASHELIDGISITLEQEFVSPCPDQEVFYTE